MKSFVTLKCSICSRTFDRTRAEARRSDRERKNHFCGLECKAKFGKIIKPCDYCGTEIEIIKSRLKAQKHHFCGPDCAKKFRIARGKVIACAVCGKQFWQPACYAGTRRFCSWDCYVKSDGRGNHKPMSSETRMKISLARKGKPVPARRKPNVKLKCEQCGKVFEVIHAPSASATRRFCSTACWYAYCHDHPEVTGRYIDNRTPDKFKAAWRGRNWFQQKRKVLRRDKYTCQRCGGAWPKVKIAVHHKRAFKSFNGDWRKANALENLVVLCTRCHKDFH